MNQAASGPKLAGQAHPSGTSTFLLTDLEGSTRLWEQDAGGMSAALERLDHITGAAAGRHRGHLVRTRGEGDSSFIVFPAAEDAVACALRLQREVIAEPWPDSTPIRMRVGIHTGEAEPRHGDYYGVAVNRCARIRGVAHGLQVLVSEATASLASGGLPQAATLLDLGLHRLRDLAVPERIFQLCHPVLPLEFPPLRSLEAFPHNLPVQLTNFIGREAQIEEVRKLLRGARLLTLAGSGGAGKTRLALQVAAEELDEYPDGVWFVELDLVSDPALVSQTLALTLGLRAGAGEPVVDSVVGHLRAKRALMVLDNCEHVIADVAELVHAVLVACPDVRIMATSREPLGVSGEWVVRVPSLTLPAPPGGGDSTPLETVTESEAVRLFVDRATRVRPDFALTTRIAPGVAEICRRLDGIPLAIELAAARVKVLSVSQIAERLDDRFRLLTGGSRTAMARQQTLRAAVDWSYDLLSEPERKVFRRFSVFAPGATLEAAEFVCSGDGPDGLDNIQVLGTLSDLVDKSLLGTDSKSQDNRFTMLDTIRVYAREKLAGSEDEAGSRRRHLQWVAGLVERAESHLLAGEQAPWLEALEAEHDNIRASLLFALESDPAAALRIGGASALFWITRGYAAEGRNWLNEALARSSPPADPAGPAGPVGPVGTEETDAAVVAKAHNAAGALAWNQGDYEAARPHYEKALWLRRRLGDRGGVAGTLANLGIVAYMQGDYEGATSLYEESLQIWREVADRQGIARTLDNLGNVAQERGDYARAHALYEESLSITRSTGDNWVLARSLNNLGEVTYLQGDVAAARPLFEEDLALARELGDKWVISRALNNLGEVAAHERDHRGAEALYQESLALARELGDRPGIAAAISGLAQLARRASDRTRSEHLHLEALAIREEIGDRRGIAESIEGLAALASDAGEFERAGVLLGAARALRSAMGSVVPPVMRGEHEEMVSRVGAGLGPAGQRDIFERGRRMKLEDAVGFARRDLEE